MKVKHLIGGGDYSSSPFQGENQMNTVVKVGDIIEGRRVTKVFSLCGGLAYQSEPVTGKVIEKNGVPFLEEFEKE